MVGLLWPTSGSIRLFGDDVVAMPELIPTKVGYFGQRVSALWAFTPVQFLQMTGQLRGMQSRPALEQARDLIEMMGLRDRANRMLLTFSGGELRLVCVLSALMGRLPVMVLDEPTAELDPVMRQRVWNVLFSYNKDAGATVILVTHNVLEAERVVDRVAIIDQGKVLDDGTPADLLRTMGDEAKLELRLKPAAAEQSGEIPGWTRLRHEFYARSAPRNEAARILYEVTGALPRDSIEDVRLVSPTLEDFYVKAVGKEWK
jgi:ABC-type multidrug transport system ATPase subunit